VDVTFSIDFPDSAATNNQDLAPYEQQSITGKLGDKFTFATPQGEGSFTVTGTYTLDGARGGTGQFSTPDHICLLTSHAGYRR
jgi:hypothetical protein